MVPNVGTFASVLRLMLGGAVEQEHQLRRRNKLIKSVTNQARLNTTSPSGLKRHEQCTRNNLKLTNLMRADAGFVAAATADRNGSKQMINRKSGG